LRPSCSRNFFHAAFGHACRSRGESLLGGLCSAQYPATSVPARARTRARKSSQCSPSGDVSGRKGTAAGGNIWKSERATIRSWLGIFNSPPPSPIAPPFHLKALLCLRSPCTRPDRALSPFFPQLREEGPAPNMQRALTWDQAPENVGLERQTVTSFAFRTPRYRPSW